MKKIGLISLALVMALGALGVGYAAWTDTVVINGTVNTGNVDLVVKNWSNTWVWKVPGDQFENEIYVAHQWEDDPTNDQAPAGAITSNRWPDGSIHYELAIADSDGPFVTPDDTVEVTFGNLFPSIPFVADFLLHYEGSIPVKVNLAEITCDNELIAGLMTVKYFDATVDETTTPMTIVKGDEIVDGIEGVQMHYCDYVIVEIGIHLPQDDAFMNLSGTITGTISAIQWNEYVAQ